MSEKNDDKISLFIREAGSENISNFMFICTNFCILKVILSCVKTFNAYSFQKLLNQAFINKLE